jgi:predicted transcriptional regulator of viral defense system
MGIEQFFYEHPVFSRSEFVCWRRESGDITAQAISVALHYYVKKGRIKLIQRELYAVVPPNQTPENLLVDSYLIAARATRNSSSILAYHTALELHGVAYSSFGQLTYLTTQKNKPFEFQGNWFQPVLMPTRLQKKHRAMFGVQTINRQGMEINITNLARTFVDVIDRVELSGGWEEVCRSLSNMVAFNVDEAIEYCLLFDNARLAAKVGYFLEQRQGAFAVNSAQLQPLLAAKPTVPQYLSTHPDEACKLIKRWSLLMPISVIQRTWEEPHVNV